MLFEVDAYFQVAQSKEKLHKKKQKSVLKKQNCQHALLVLCVSSGQQAYLDFSPDLYLQKQFLIDWILQAELGVA